MRKLRTLGPITDMHSPTATLGQTETMPATPSRHHHLTHVALRAAALDDPNFVLQMLASPDAKPFLNSLSVTHSSVPPSGTQACTYNGDGVCVHLVQVDCSSGTIVEMPPPQSATEAYFVALLPMAETHDPPQPPAATALRYFVLEKGTGDATGEATVLCEWSQLHGWRRLGDGPPPQLDRFVDALRRLMQ